MKRYLNSFLITLILYSGVIFSLFVIFTDERIILKKEKLLQQTISLKHCDNARFCFSYFPQRTKPVSIFAEGRRIESPSF